MYDNCLTSYVEARGKYSFAIKSEARDQEIRKKWINYNTARNAFYTSIIDVLLENKRFTDLQPHKIHLHLLLNNLWLNYFQEMDVITGDFHPITHYNHLKELRDEVQGLKELEVFLTTFNLDQLRKADFPIDIKYNKRTLASTNSYRIWSKVFDVLQREMLANPLYTLSMEQAELRYFTKNKREKNIGELYRIEMTAAICDFLNAITEMQTRDKQSDFIAMLYTLLKVPIYKGKTPVETRFEKQHIHGYLKKYVYNKDKTPLLRLQYGLPSN